MLRFYDMTVLVVTLLLATADGSLQGDDRQAARVERDRCLGAGAAGAVGVALGLVVGGGVAFGVGELVKAADPNNTSASKGFDAFAIPFGALAGGVAGAAIGTI